MPSILHKFEILVAVAIDDEDLALELLIDQIDDNPRMMVKKVLTTKKEKV